MSKHPSQSAATQEQRMTFPSKIHRSWNPNAKVIEVCNFKDTGLYGEYHWPEMIYGVLSFTVAIFRVKWKDVDKST